MTEIERLRAALEQIKQIACPHQLATDTPMSRVLMSVEIQQAVRDALSPAPPDEAHREAFAKAVFDNDYSGLAQLNAEDRAAKSDARAALLAAVEQIPQRAYREVLDCVLRGKHDTRSAIGDFALDVADVLRNLLTDYDFPALLDAALTEARADQRRRDAERLRVLNNAWRMGDYRDAKTERIWNQAADDLMAVRAAIERGEDARTGGPDA